MASNMNNNWPYVINLSNSIIGISTLAMPFCFKQCGILLGILLLLLCTWLTLVSCQILMKAGVTSRRSSYGFLAYYTFGVSGKLAVELGMIGLQIGTLIAQIVVIGDFGPTILSKILGIPNSSNIRTALIIFLCLGIGLPLGLLKDLRAVSRASTVCVCFYVVFIIYVLVLSTPNLLSGNWYPKVAFWKADGLFETLPIFAFSFGCQTQLFILYDALPEPSLKTVNGITSSAVNLCAVAYLLMGFFGYIAFHEMEITGDIIKLFPETLFADIMKLGFVISTAITIPLIIFPCRVSLYNLLFSQIRHKAKSHDDSIPEPTHIPEIHFKVLTLLIVLGPMIAGILVPNVEFILSFNGATMGTLMCFIFPPMFFLRVNKGEAKGLAQFILVCGITIMLVSTFAIFTKKPHEGHQVKETIKEIIEDMNLPEKKINDIPVVKDILEKEKKKDKRIEPVNPLAPDDDKLKIVEKKKKEEVIDKIEKRQVEKKADGNDEIVRDKEKVIKDDDSLKKKDDSLNKNSDSLKKKDDTSKKNDNSVKKPDGLEKILKEKEKEMEKAEIKQKDLLNKLEKQQEESKRLLEAQKELMDELKDHKKEHLDEKVVNNPVDSNVVGQLPQQNVAPQQNIVPQQNVAGQQNIVPQQNLVPQQNAVPQQNIIPQQNVAGQQNIVPQQNLAPQQKVVPQQNVAPQQNIVPQQNVAGQQNIVPQQNVAQNNIGGQVPIQNNLAGQGLVQNNVGGQVPIGGQAPVQNVGGQVPIGGQAPVQNMPVQNNIGGQAPVQNNIPVLNNAGAQIPGQNAPLKYNVGGGQAALGQNNVPVVGQAVDAGQAGIGQAPVGGGQVPLQNFNQVPVENNNFKINKPNVNSNGNVLLNRNKRHLNGVHHDEPVNIVKNEIIDNMVVDMNINDKNDEMRRKLRNVEENIQSKLSLRTLLTIPPEK